MSAMSFSIAVGQLRNLQCIEVYNFCLKYRQITWRGEQPFPDPPQLRRNTIFWHPIPWAASRSSVITSNFSIRSGAYSRSQWPICPAIVIGAYSTASNGRIAVITFPRCSSLRRPLLRVLATAPMYRLWTISVRGWLLCAQHTGAWCSVLHRAAAVQNVSMVCLHRVFCYNHISVCGRTPLRELDLPLLPESNWAVSRRPRFPF